MAKFYLDQLTSPFASCVDNDDISVFFFKCDFCEFFFFFKCEFCEFQGNRVKRHYFTFFIWKFVLQKFKGSHLSVTSRVSEGKLDMIETLIS